MSKKITLAKTHSVDSLKALNGLFGDMDELPPVEPIKVTSFSSLDKLNARSLHIAIKNGDAETYVKFVSTEEGRKVLAMMDDDTKAKALALSNTIKSQHDSSTFSTPKEQSGMDSLAKTYISSSVQSLLRVPSMKLKPDYRATLQHWGSLVKAALKTEPSESKALINAILAVVATEGAFEALKLVRNVGSQLLWQASVDISRDRRAQNDINPPSSFTDGEEDHVDSEYVAPPTEDEALDSYIEAHSWLSNVADLLATDEDDRLRLGLESGLECTQSKQGAEWVRIYSYSTAIEMQLEKNLASMKNRDAAKIIARKDAFAALAALAA